MSTAHLPAERRSEIARMGALARNANRTRKSFEEANRREVVAARQRGGATNGKIEVDPKFFTDLHHLIESWGPQLGHRNRPAKTALAGPVDFTADIEDISLLKVGEALVVTLRRLRGLGYHSVSSGAVHAYQTAQRAGFKVYVMRLSRGSMLIYRPRANEVLRSHTL